MDVPTACDGSYVRADRRCCDKAKSSCKIYFCWRGFWLKSFLKIVRSDQHSRETRAAFKPHLKPLGFFGKLAYMGGLLFQVSSNLCTTKLVKLKTRFFAAIQRNDECFWPRQGHCQRQLFRYSHKRSKQTKSAIQLTHFVDFIFIAGCWTVNLGARWNDDGKIPNFKGRVRANYQQKLEGTAKVNENWTGGC